MIPVGTFFPSNIIQRVRNRIVIAAASLHRRRFKEVNIIAVTGSCGKTTTTTLLAGILAAHECTISNPQSKNRTMAVAETLLKLRSSHRHCVLEIGAQGPNTLDRPLAVAKPTVGVVTHIMNDHYSNFRGLQNVANEKARLVQGLPANGMAVLNADDPLVAGMRGLTRAPCISYGLCSGADVRMVDLCAVWPEPLSGTILVNGQTLPFRTSLFGVQSATAVMAAVAAAAALGIAPQSAVQALEKIPSPPHRMQGIEDRRGIAFVLDDIKAPLYAMPAIFKFTAEARARRKILVIGQLSDYAGSSSPKYRRVAREALMAADWVLLVGKYAQSGLKGQPADIINHRLFAFRHLVELNGFLQPRLHGGDMVVLKGSFKQDHMERLIMARDRPVSCWRPKCGRVEDCRQCDLRQTRFHPIEGNQE